ncbi:hypothetical protein PENTCL1PPCAC_10000, partial [Pristionchus entomophagus]
GLRMSYALNATQTQQKRIPKIIAWNEYFSSSLSERIRSYPCPYRCDVFDRTELPEEDADVIVFHFRNLWDPNMTFPKTRRPDQIYVSFLKSHSSHAGSAINDPRFATNFFNATVDYRLNNFIYFDQSYFAPVATEEDREKMRPLSEELSKFINVTKTGWCYGRRISAERQEELIKSYFFVIAFENISCKDYATEKFWRIEKDIVPIVLRRWILKPKAPDGAYVAADDFESPREMAEHLKNAIENQDVYRKYFAYRNTHYKVTVDGFCNLCRNVHFNNVSATSHLDMKEYYSVSRECEFGTGNKLLSKAHHGERAIEETSFEERVL